MVVGPEVEEGGVPADVENRRGNYQAVTLANQWDGKEAGALVEELALADSADVRVRWLPLVDRVGTVAGTEN
jgi:hypothetical protein